METIYLQINASQLRYL